MHENALRVSIVEDNDLIRADLATLLDRTDGYDCLASYRNAEALFCDLEGKMPDVLLFDIQSSRASGVEAVADLNRRAPQLPVVALSYYEDSDLGFEALCAGACGYMSKQTHPSRLLEAIAEAHGGGSPMNARFARKLVDRLRENPGRQASSEAAADLSDRETAVLRGLASGQGYKEIAQDSNISVDTVRYYIRKVYKRLEAHTKSEAVATAFRMGLI